MMEMMENFSGKNLGAFFAEHEAAKNRGVERSRVPLLQFLSPPAAGLRDFRFNPGSWASNDFALQNRDQPPLRPTG
jgi:hypothetical protein